MSEESKEYNPLDSEYHYEINYPKPGIQVNGQKHYNHRHLSMDEGFLWTAARMNRIIEKAPLKVFVADLNYDFWCPWRLTNVKHAILGQIDACGELILDSGIGDPNIKNPELIEQAERMGEGVTWVVPKDYSNDTDATIASVKEFFSLAPEWIKDRAIVPLQGTCPEDYVRCYEELKHLSRAGYFGFGGIAGKSLTKAPTMQSVQAKKAAVKFLLDNTDVQQIHLFGQTNLNWVDMYHDDRIVSCDSNRFGADALHRFDVPRGPNSGGMYGWLVMSEFYAFLMRISDGYRPQGRQPKQHEFGDFFGEQ